jgi:hypothetical protein
MSTLIRLSIPKVRKIRRALTSLRWKKKMDKALSALMGYEIKLKTRKEQGL